MKEKSGEKRRRLKVKIRSFLTVVALISIVLFGAGTAHAVWGVPDDVKGQDLVWPFLCAETPGTPNSIQTNWAIADLVGGTPDAGGNVATMNCTLWSAKSTLIVDFIYTWTPFQVVVDDCNAFLNRHPGARF